MPGVHQAVKIDSPAARAATYRRDYLLNNEAKKGEL
jgi:hypothetical protein